MAAEVRGEPRRVAVANERRDTLDRLARGRQQPDGTVLLPPVLLPYLGTDRLVPPA